MKKIKDIFLLSLILVMGCTSFAQKQTFDVLSYNLPKGWQEQKNEAGIQLSAIDKKTGAYAIIVITKSIPTDASASENFNKDWFKLVKGLVHVDSEPAMQNPINENGWVIISGNANYTDGENKGMATLLTATGGKQTASVVLMTNAKQYQNDLSAFITSLELKKALENKEGNSSAATATGDTKNSALVGIWAYNLLETSGYVNGQPQYTAGYFRKEYTFKSDGTYTHFRKNWSVYSKPILYIYETGTWAISGNKLIISPTKGRAETWSKSASGRTTEWGTLQQSENAKLEKVTYTFEIKNFPGSQSTALLLTYNEPTERDASSNNNGGTQITSFSWRKEALIDFPPGFNFSAAKPSPSSTNVNSINSSAVAINSPIAGKIWLASTPEKYGAAYGSLSGFYSGGFWIYQYKFNNDGTYSFVYNAASAFSNKPVNLLQYETGIYAVNGNQLTITPQKGANEEWGVEAINNGMSAEHKRELLEKRVKLLKTTARKLEKLTYTFSVEYWQGNNANALCLKHTNSTEREGSPGANNQSCFFEISTQKAVKY